MRWLGREQVWLDVAGSTNDEVMARARAGGPHGLVVIADEQTRGRGRLGRAWHSPKGENLYFSVLLRFDRPPAWAPMLTLAAGVAVCECLNHFGAVASIKWPNDVCIEGKKVAGILTESSTQGGRLEAVALGIGVNVNTESFPDELAAIATSARLALGTRLDRREVAGELMARVEAEIDRYEKEGGAAVAERWRRWSGTLGKQVEVGPVVGTATDVDEEGGLWVERADGERVRVTAGEVRIR